MMTLSFATPWVQRERNTNLVSVWHVPLACRKRVTVVLFCSFAPRMLLLHIGKSSSKAQIFSELYSTSCTSEGGSIEHLWDGQGARTYCWRPPETGEGKVLGYVVCNFVDTYAHSLLHVQGVMFQSASGQLALRGTVTTVSADNLGSHAIGGFKEGGRALRCCRHCMVPTDDMGSKVSWSSLNASTWLVPLEIVFCITCFCSSSKTK